MKNLNYKIFLTIAVFLLSREMHAQNAYTKLISDKIIDKINAVIISEGLDETNDNYYTIITRLPKYYDLDLVISSCKTIVDQYSKIKVNTNWKLQENGRYRIIYEVLEEPLIISYYEDGLKKMLTFYMPAK